MRESILNIYIFATFVLLLYILCMFFCVILLPFILCIFSLFFLIIIIFFVHSAHICTEMNEIFYRIKPKNLGFTLLSFMFFSKLFWIFILLCLIAAHTHSERNWASENESITKLEIEKMTTTTRTHIHIYIDLTRIYLLNIHRMPKRTETSNKKARIA